VHYLANLQNRVNVTSSSFCLSMAYGTLLGNPVMVVASGIGPTTAALCALELLQCRSGVHLTSLTPTANQAACLSCATNGKSGCLFKLCIIPLTYRAVHIDCSMLMPSFQSMRMDYLDSQ